jgi:hypothetical protein
VEASCDVGGRDDDDVGVVKLQVRGLRILGSAPFGSFSIDIDNMVSNNFCCPGNS